MRVGTILKKIKKHLTEEEKSVLLKELQKNPEKIIEMLTPETEDELEAYANKIILDIQKAFREFGSYSYYDKGPSDVMDIDKYVEEFKKMPMKDVQTILLKVSEFKDGEPFCSAVVSNLDDLPEDKWEELMSHDKMGYFY